jgi:hypothetical protein
MRSQSFSLVWIVIVQVEGAAGGFLPELLGPRFGVDCNWFGLVLQMEGAAGGPLPEQLGPGFGMVCNWFGLVLQVEGAAGRVSASAARS